MSLRVRGYVVEASPDRDSAVRETGVAFFDDLSRYLKSIGKNSIHKFFEFDSRDYSYYLDSAVFSRDPFIRFTLKITQRRGKSDPKNGGYDRHSKTINLNLIPHNAVGGVITGEALNWELQDAKDTVVHEMTHALDKGLGKGKNIHGFDPKHPNQSDTEYAVSNPEEYVNRPTEWNAFWQAGASKLEDALSDSGKFKWKTVSDLLDNAYKFWDKGFLKYSDKDTTRKFQKRLGQLFTELQAKYGKKR